MRHIALGTNPTGLKIIGSYDDELELKEVLQKTTKNYQSLYVITVPGDELITIKKANVTTCIEYTKDFFECQ